MRACMPQVLYYAKEQRIEGRRVIEGGTTKRCLSIVSKESKEGWVELLRKEYCQMMVVNFPIQW